MVASTASDGRFSVWFIDYRIKRNPRHQATPGRKAHEQGKNPPKVFYASDRRFVEVKNGQLGKRPGHKPTWNRVDEGLFEKAVTRLEERGGKCGATAAFDASTLSNMLRLNPTR
jgi:hypothetical protein